MNRYGINRYQIKPFTTGIVLGLVLASLLPLSLWYHKLFILPSKKRNSHLGRPLIIAFGDSITQRGYENDGGWTTLMSDWYSRKADFINRGFSGYNSKWGLEIFEEVVLNNEPDLVLIFFGANDAVVPEVAQHVPLKDYIQIISAMIRTIKVKLPHTDIILITPPPIFEPLLQIFNKEKGKAILIDRSNDNTLEYVKACKNIANEYNIPVVDCWTGMDGMSSTRENFLIDGLHLNKMFVFYFINYILIS